MGNTSSEIYERMTNDLKLPASKMAGSFTADNLLAVANEIARIYSIEYDRLLSRAHVRTAAGEDLDVAAKENHGMIRNPATAEEVNLTIIGQPGAIINDDMRVRSGEVVYQIMGTYTVGDSGEVQVSAQCINTGAGYGICLRLSGNLLKAMRGWKAYPMRKHPVGDMMRKVMRILRRG